MRTLYFSAIVLALAVTVVAQPTIRATADGVVNNASYAPAGLPNSSIAQGSIFAIFGSNLGPAALAQQPSYPLQKTLAGTSVKVTVGGTAVDAIPIYTVAGQVGAVLPSKTPTGAGTVTVTYNGATSSSHAITVVPSSVGMFTLNQAGTGPAVITDANYNVITISNSAKPGQPLIIWGTGVGPITGDDAATPAPTDLPHPKVYIGGAVATVTYAGRSGCCSGLDQIVVTVPSGVSGCYVSVAVVTNNNVASNSTTLPVMPNGGACSDPNGVGSSDLTGLLGKDKINLGYLSLGRTTTQTPGITVPGVGTIGGSTTKEDFGSGIFYRYTPQQLAYSQGLFQQTSIGSCAVFRYMGSSASGTDPVRPVPLDAGASITLTGGTSPQTLARDATLGFYTTPVTGTNPLLFIPDAGGTFTFANGSGGADVGAISNASIALGAPIIWTNMDSITNVNRANDLPITWTGGNAGTYVQISGGSAFINGTDTSSAQYVSFVCEAPASAGNFSVPAAVLLQLPVGGTSVGGISIPTGSLSVGNYANPVKFTATGIDLGYVSAYVTSGKTVNYQ